MRLLVVSAALLSSFAVAAQAQEAAAPAAVAAPASDVRVGALVKTVDGRRVGRIERLIKDGAGQVVSASIIYQSRFVRVPVNTLSAVEKGFVTSLTTKEILSAN